MTYFNIILFHSIIYILCLFNNVLALSIERITGGYSAEIKQFAHQVAILAKPNNFDEDSLICSGSFIHVNFILSAAECFVDNNGVLKKYLFSIVTDTIHWKLMKSIAALIELIYLPSGGNYYLNNIAVAKLEADFTILDYPALRALGIAGQNESFYNQIGTVSGYGDLLPLDMTQDDERRDFFREISGFLSYAKVLITSNTWCVLRDDMGIDIDKHFCGLMLSDIPGQPWGLCEKDTGSPLVYENKIVAIAGKNNRICDDTIIGHGYTQVSPYAPFIKSIINRSPLPDTLIHRNGQHLFHLMPFAAPAA